MENNTLVPEKAQEELQNLFRNIDEAFFSVDLKERRILQMSAACEQIYGYTSEEFIEDIKLWTSVIHPDDKYIVKENEAKFEDGKSVTSQFRIIHKNGSVRWVEGKIIPQLDEVGKLVRVDGVIRDITKRKKAEERALEAEKLIVEAQELDRTGNFNVNVVTNEVYWSAGLRNIHGVDKDFVASFEAFIGTIHIEDRDRVVSQLLKNEELKGKLDIEYRIIRVNDAQVRVFYSRINTVKDENGNLIRIYGISQDITERKIAEEKVLQTEHLLSEGQKLAKMGNWSADFIKKEVFWSEGLRSIYGVDNDFPASFMAFIGLIHNEDRDRVYLQVIHSEETGNSLDMEYRIIRQNDNTIRTVHSHLHANKNKAGILQRVYGVSKDITERKQAEAKVEQLNLLIYQMSHDLRGPINSAKNYIYLASVKVDDKIALGYIDKIHSSYRKIEDHLMSLLNLQRITRSETVIEKIDLKEIIEQIIRSIDNIPSVQKVKVEIDVDLPESFYSDKQYIHSILYNLINNAIKYKRDIPDSLINISAHTSDSGIEISIADNGIGMGEEISSRIFEMFFRANTNSSGSGLGLYIVKSLVERLKGNISVTSEPMKGSAFSINLPALPISK